MTRFVSLAQWFDSNPDQSLDTQYRCVIRRPPHFIYEQQEDGSWTQRDETPEELAALNFSVFNEVPELPPDPFLDHYL